MKFVLNKKSAAWSEESELERGSIESGLVLIPTTLFFLVALQVLLAGSWQTIERARLHDIVVESSIRDSLSDSQDMESESKAMQLFESSSRSFNGQAPIYFSQSGSKSRLISVKQESTPVGTLQLYEMKTELPILGEFLGALDTGLFHVRNRAVSFVS